MLNGDYSTGNLSQWQTVQTKYYNTAAMQPTGIVYHAGFRAATEEGGLN